MKRSGSKLPNSDGKQAKPNPKNSAWMPNSSFGTQYRFVYDNLPMSDEAMNIYEGIAEMLEQEKHEPEPEPCDGFENDAEIDFSGLHTLGKGRYTGGFQGDTFVLDPFDKSHIMTLIDCGIGHSHENLVANYDWEEYQRPRNSKVTKKNKPLTRQEKKSEEINMKICKLINAYDRNPIENIRTLAKIAELNERKASKYIKEYQSTAKIPKEILKVPKKKIGEDQLAVITIEYRKKKAECGRFQTEDAIKALSENFSDLSVSKPTLYKGFKEIGLSYKKVRNQNINLNSPELILQRQRWLHRAKSRGVDFRTNCIFIDEASFDNNITFRKAWDLRGSTPTAIVDKTRAKTFTVLGAITATHVVNLSIKIPLEKKDITEAILDESIPIERNPANADATDNIFFEFDPNPNPRKPKKVREKEITDAKLLEQSQLKMIGTNMVTDGDGTSRGHMMCFLWKVMSDLKHDANLRNCFIVLDNVATHKGIEISHLVNLTRLRNIGTV
ncbi:unnamed protein product [Ambrosiozyma monospora]|uniref:Unnamed protein product n=1 Tax=Ambrosiozyma monospora TaxID=43982 RepID=A0A9W6Z7K4_AMBMO|nr:unnamed protein product [Ambrosiozyma monospora]